MNLFFGILTIAVFSFFAFTLSKTWLRIKKIGQGVEENRKDHIWRRIKDVFIEGFLQKRMYNDVAGGVMHLLIFWGFFIVSVGTIETLIYGIFHVNSSTVPTPKDTASSLNSIGRRRPVLRWLLKKILGQIQIKCWCLE